MKKGILAFIGALALAVMPVSAQVVSNYAGIANAVDFAYGVAGGGPALQVFAGNSAAGTYAITLNYGDATTGSSGIHFNPFSGTILPPIAIGSGSTYEVVTPTSASCSTPTVYQTCTITATFAYAHGNGDQVRSGDGGLTEAANYQLSQGAGLVALSPKWFQLMGLSVTNKTALGTALAAYKSVSPDVTVLDYSGATGTTAATEALSYTAAAGSAYASTTHVIY